MERTFAAGVMLWEAATAQRLWKDMEDIGVIQALLTDEISRSPKSVDPTVPDEIDRICQKALQKNREDRYATAEEFRQDLESVLSDLGILNEGRKRLDHGCRRRHSREARDHAKAIETQLSSAQEAGNDQTHPYKLLVLKPGEDEDAIATKQVDSDRRNSGTPDPDRGAVDTNPSLPFARRNRSAGNLGNRRCSVKVGKGAHAESARRDDSGDDGMRPSLPRFL